VTVAHGLEKKLPDKISACSPSNGKRETVNRKGDGTALVREGESQRRKGSCDKKEKKRRLARRGQGEAGGRFEAGIFPRRKPKGKTKKGRRMDRRIWWEEAAKGEEKEAVVFRIVGCGKERIFCNRAGDRGY